MRIVLFLLFSALALAGPASGAPRITSVEESLGWIKGYRDRPNPDAVPALIQQLSAIGAFDEPEAAGVYVGFMAGVIGGNVDRARHLVDEMAAIPPVDQWAVVKAIAYSRLPGWRHLMRLSAHHMPTRRVMMNAYLGDRLPGFERYTLARPPSRLARLLTFAEEETGPILAPSPAILDTLWGYYFATGSLEPLMDVAELAGWSADQSDVARLVLGNTAKYSLAANASRDAPLLAAVRRIRRQASEDLGPILDEVIFAAEVSETAKLRDEAAEVINLVRLKGPGYQRKIAWWGKAGEGAIALGCVVAAVTGQVQLGVPCVIGGAVTSAAVKYFASGS